MVLHQASIVAVALFMAACTLPPHVLGAWPVVKRNARPVASRSMSHREYFR